MGPQESLEAFPIEPQDDMAQKRQDLIQRVTVLNQGQGVFVLTDMFGGTPSNLALSLQDLAWVDIVAGVNLPMLLKILTSRQSSDLEQTVHAGQEAGRKYIHVASDLLRDTA
jgi:PTS system mannose-specific IIA component